MEWIVNEIFLNNLNRRAGIGGDAVHFDFPAADSNGMPVSGETVKVPSLSRNPSSSSVNTRKYHPAEPVYQVQPQRPMALGLVETSAGITKGSA